MEDFILYNSEFSIENKLLFDFNTKNKLPLIKVSAKHLRYIGSKFFIDADNLDSIKRMTIYNSNLYEKRNGGSVLFIMNVLDHYVNGETYDLSSADFEISIGYGNPDYFYWPNCVS